LNFANNDFDDGDSDDNDDDCSTVPSGPKKSENTRCFVYS